MRIAVAGSGYVGLVTAACLARLGHEVTCVDQVRARVDAIAAGRTPFFEPGLGALVSKETARGRLRASMDLEGSVAAADVSFIAVGTPERRGAIDLRDVEAASARIGAGLRRRRGAHTVVVKSTVVPGTSRGVVLPALERASGKKAGGFQLCVNPEFTREGSAIDDFLHPDRIVVGSSTLEAATALRRVYRRLRGPRIETTLENAELIKYASNAFLATLISFSNEIAGVCELVPGADVDAVLEGLHRDRRLSVAGARARLGVLDYLRAGIGFGGNCLPKDVNALRAYSRQRGTDARLLDAVMEVNARRPGAVVDQLERSIGSLRGARVAVLGLAFKPGTDDVRRSPAQPVIRLLLEKGAAVRAYDPVAKTPSPDPKLNARVQLCGSAEDALRGADAAVLATAWPAFAKWPWPRLAGLMRRPVVADGRGALKAVRWPPSVTYLRPGLFHAAHPRRGYNRR